MKKKKGKARVLRVTHILKHLIEAPMSLVKKSMENAIELFNKGNENMLDQPKPPKKKPSQCEAASLGVRPHLPSAST